MKHITKKKRVKRSIYYRNTNGILTHLRPKDTYWYLAYVASPDLSNPHFHRKFRLRFRMPYDSFLTLLDEVCASDMFHQWKIGRTFRNKREVSPIQLLLLGTLRYLGRGWTMDDLEEATGISEVVHNPKRKWNVK